jgi:hypothetical protein
MKVLDLRRREFVEKHHHQARFVGYERFASNLTKSAIDSMTAKDGPPDGPLRDATRPPERKPLTEEVIKRIVDLTNASGDGE